MDSLLQAQIQGGLHLRKTQTNDRSAPILGPSPSSQPSTPTQHLTTPKSIPQPPRESPPSPSSSPSPSPSSPKRERIPSSEPLKPSENSPKPLNNTDSEKVESNSAAPKQTKKAKKQQPAEIQVPAALPPNSPLQLSPRAESARLTTGDEKRATDKAKRLSQQPISTRNSVALTLGTETSHVSEELAQEFTLAEKLVWEIVPERRIRLADAEKVGNWFKQHTAYLVINDNTQVEVRRRYNDFVWLKTMVTKQLPQCFVPPIPGKQAFGRFEGAFVFRRQKGLQRLLNRLNENPMIQNHPAFIAFMTETDEKKFAEHQKEQELICKQLEKKAKTKVTGVDPSKGDDHFIAHDLSLIKPDKFVISLRTYLVRFKKGLEMLNKNRTRLNEDQKANGAYISDLGGTFEEIFNLETSCPIKSDTFAASLSRQHLDLQKLTQWNIEHITLRDESFSDSLSDYIGVVTEFLKFVKNYEEEELQPFERWREAYISAKLLNLRKTMEGTPTKTDIKAKLGELLAADEPYIQVTKNFFYHFDQLLTESELFFTNRSLEMKIILRSFVACWKLYSQAVVACLQENMTIIGEMDGRMYFSSLVNRTAHLPKSPSDPELDRSEFDVRSTIFSLADFTTDDKFVKKSFTFKSDPAAKARPPVPSFEVSPPPSAGGLATAESPDHMNSESSPPASPSASVMTASSLSSTPTMEAPPPPAPFQSPPPATSTAFPPPPPPPPSAVSPTTSSPIPPRSGARGNLLRDIENPTTTLKKVPEEEKNTRRTSAFDGPTNPLEIGNLFNQISGLRTRLGYGKNGGDGPQDDEEEVVADDWASESSSQGNGKAQPPGPKTSFKGKKK